MEPGIQAVEYFHLQVSRLLLAGPDKGSFAIKGGCNLRFFFESPRYSEDIDFDVGERVPVHALKDRMTKLLSGPALTLNLRNRGIEVASASAPKQTETTQRWRIALTVPLGRTAQIRTRVGTFSVHHVGPQFFGGATLDHRTGVRLASPEKALVDFLYLSPARSRLFARLPEVELPAGFSRGEARRWAGRIPSARVRTIVARELDRLRGARRTRVKGSDRRRGRPAASARRPAP